MRTLISLVLLLSSFSLFADQCGVVRRDQAAKAIFELLEAETVIEQCNLCQDREPKKIEVKTLSVQKYNDLLVEVVLNGEVVDLAYLFVDGENLGELSNCSVL